MHDHPLVQRNQCLDSVRLFFTLSYEGQLAARVREVAFKDIVTFGTNYDTNQNAVGFRWLLHRTFSVLIEGIALM